MFARCQVAALILLNAQSLIMSDAKSVGDPSLIFAHDPHACRILLGCFCILYVTQIFQHNLTRLFLHAVCR